MSDSIPATITIHTYTWSGYDKSGRYFAGVIDAESHHRAVAELHDQGVIIKSVALQQTSRLQWTFLSAAPKVNDLFHFTSQLQLLLSSGITLDKAVSDTITSSLRPPVKLALERLLTDIRNGSTLAEAMAAQPQLFPADYRACIDAGERAHSLPATLSQQVTVLEKRLVFTRHIKAALRYPLIVAVAALVILGALLVTVVPVFASLYDSMGGELPASTQAMLAISEAMRQHGWWWLLLLTATLAGWRAATQRVPKWRAWQRDLLLYLPGIRRLQHATFTASTFRSLAALRRADISITAALRMLADDNDSHYFRQILYEIAERLGGGVSVAIAMASYRHLPTYILRMLANGEQTGKLEQTLDVVASLCEHAVEDAAASMKSTVEPLLIGITGLLIGGVMLLLYLPIFRAGGIV